MAVNFKVGEGMGGNSREKSVFYPTRLFFILFLTCFIFQTSIAAQEDSAKSAFQDAVAFGKAGNRVKAAEHYSKALVLLPSDEQSELKAEILLGLGTQLARTGHFQNGIAYLYQALDWFKQRDQPSKIAEISLELGFNLEEINEAFAARRFEVDALRLYRQLGDRKGEGRALIRLGKATYIQHRQNNDLRETLKILQRALKIQEELRDNQGKIQTLVLLGIVYREQGFKEKSLPFSEEAVRLAEKIDDAELANLSYSELGDYHGENKDWEKAFYFHQLAIQEADESGNPFYQFGSLITMGTTHRRFGKYPEALDLYLKAYEIVEKIGDPVFLMATCKVIAGTYRRLGNQEQALFWLDKPTPLLNSIRFVQEKNDFLFSHATFQRLFGHLEKSRRLMEQVIQVAESNRQTLVDPEEQTAFFASQQIFYRFYTDLLMLMSEKTGDTSFQEEAFNLTERARARTFQERLAESRFDFRKGVPSSLLEKEQETLRKFTFLSGQLLRSTDSNQASEARFRVEEVGKELAAIQGEIRKLRPHYQVFADSRPLNIKELQNGVLDSDTVLLSYSLGGGKVIGGGIRGFLWIVTRSGVESVVLPETASIEASVIALLDFFSGKPTTQSQVDLALKKLGTLILPPTVSRLKNKKLVFIPDGFLNLVPFAALKTDAGYLIEDNEVVVLPSASSIVAIRMASKDNSRNGKVAAVFANPVFSATDSRLTQFSRKPERRKGVVAPPLNRKRVKSRSDQILAVFGESLPAVPLTAEQGQEIIQLAGADRCFLAEGLVANKTVLSELDLSIFRILHFATHGRFDAETPELSGLALSLVDEKGNEVDGFLLLPEIYELKLNGNLVVLSACQSGRGVQIRGEGVMGMTRAFMFAGANRVIASLWNVGESSTTELMKLFYRSLLSSSDPLSASASLRKAQIEMIRNPNPAMRSPVKWGAFQLHGDWR